MASEVAGLIGAGVAVGGMTAGWLGYRWDERRRRAHVFDNGVKVVGWLVQANRELFYPGIEDAPAQMLISFDAPDGDGLEALAAEVGRLKVEPPSTPAERAVAAVARDVTSRPTARLRLPPEFTGGRDVYSVTVWIERRLLPEGRLTEAERSLALRAVPGADGRVYMEPPGD